MENFLLNSLDENIRCNSISYQKNQISFGIASTKEAVKCPYCGNESQRIHSRYQREIQDIPLQDKQVILLLETRKMFCDNPDCGYKTFCEHFDFVLPNQKKTNRLIEKILVTSTKLSSINAAKLLKADSVTTSKSSICNLLKKNANACG